MNAPSCLLMIGDGELHADGAARFRDAGLPVVASHTGGNPELIDDDVNGILVPPGDRDALAQAITGYIQDPDRRARHGTASRERVVSLFSITTMVNSYRQLYQSALGIQVT